jgi:threonine/homoserine/homoserine lactone efflux protein
MTLQTWWLFTTAVFLLCGTPGPNMLHVMTRSLRFGFRRSVAAMAGCYSAILLAMAASAAGLTALLMARPGAFEALRYGGVAYLIWLGVKAWRGGDAPLDVGGADLAPTLSRAALFRGGFLIAIGNPKLLLFAAAFLPQFIDHARPQGPQFAILVVTFSSLELFWYAVYGLGGQRLSGLLTRPGLQRWFNRLTGTVFVGFGLALLKLRPS